ncbi:hypothetical protein D0T51_11105 [Parabacteroides sp. 52]|uniref:glycerophosphoryl diester phosphodiesterase membrane domain-containing protein n=1 Tax=unclassified Parabacteroides TaxID=2649774 RepID=UPI0013D2371E|nr:MULTISPECIES: glycerophosphoryl diester phosphodiesterase membrane domain-containing protein [unclassified Parabacteroides]MDH6535665.1 putative membrane protein [Parabacteroides sp. PM5-20]NDV56273.1 hypothetical protein [Parabacteroides sp. 52]
MKPAFTIQEVLQTSWKSFKEQIWILVGLFIGFSILSGVISFFASPASTLSIIVVNIISLVISNIFLLGYYKNIFQALDHIEPQFSAYGQQAHKFFTAFIATLLFSILVLCGFVLLVIPGIYLSVRLQFFLCFIVEEDAGIIDSLKRSWEITKGQFLPLFLLLLAEIAIGLIGVLLLFVGVFVAGPFIYMIQCYTFRKLNNPVAAYTEEMESVTE